MQWSEVVKRPPERMLRQFAGLWLVFFLGLAALRWFRGAPDQWAVGLAVLAVVVGGAGLVAPALIRPIYTGWMIAAFPIGWTISRVILGTIFFGVITPIAAAFRLSGRDALRRRRHQRRSYWLDKRQPTGSADYFRQS
jgi:hypothetical protein